MAEREVRAPPTAPFNVYVLDEEMNPDPAYKIVGYAQDLTGAISIACAVYNIRQRANIDVWFSVGVYDNAVPPVQKAFIGQWGGG